MEDKRRLGLLSDYRNTAIDQNQHTSLGQIVGNTGVSRLIIQRHLASKDFLNRVGTRIFHTLTAKLCLRGR